MPASAAEIREYVCPGEGYAIPRAVHRARMESGFARCRECPLSVAGAGSGHHESPPLSPFRRLIRTDGVRGTFRNEIDTATAGRFAEGLAAVLWEDAGGKVPASGFPVVVGYDDRPWSLPLAVAAAAALRRCGCGTVEIGLATGPAFHFAVHHLEAAAGILATGAGGGPAVAGLDFALAGGRPLSLGGTLDRIADLAEGSKRGRMTRSGGGRREYDVGVPYEASLRRHIRPSGPRSVVVGSASLLVLSRISRLSQEFGSTVTILPLARRDSADGADPIGLERTGAAVVESEAAFGLWVAEDGAACRAVDESGKVVAAEDLAALLIADAAAERPGAPVVLDWALADHRSATAASRGEIVRSNGTAEAMAISVRDQAPVAGADATGRFWLPGPPPASDAFVTFMRLIRAVGTGTTPMSIRLAEASRRG